MATVPPIPKVPAKKPSAFSVWYAGHKSETLIGVAGLVVGIAAYVRSRSSSAAAAATTPTSTASTTTPTGTYTGGGYGEGGGDASGLEEQIGALGAAVSALQTAGFTGSQPAQPASAPTTTVAQSSAPAIGYGSTDIGGQEYDVLGYGQGDASGATYNGYNVGGGAPVFFETPGGSTPSTNLSAQGLSALPTGTELLTPAAYGSQVSSSATAQNEQIT